MNLLNKYQEFAFFAWRMLTNVHTLMLHFGPFFSLKNIINELQCTHWIYWIVLKFNFVEDHSMHLVYELNAHCSLIPQYTYMLIGYTWKIYLTFFSRVSFIYMSSWRRMWFLFRCIHLLVIQSDRIRLPWSQNISSDKPINFQQFGCACLTSYLKH